MFLRWNGSRQGKEENKIHRINNLHAHAVTAKQQHPDQRLRACRADTARVCVCVSQWWFGSILHLLKSEWKHFNNWPCFNTQFWIGDQTLIFLFFFVCFVLKEKSHFHFNFGFFDTYKVDFFFSDSNSDNYKATSTRHNNTSNTSTTNTFYCHGMK